LRVIQGRDARATFLFDIYRRACVKSLALPMKEIRDSASNAVADPSGDVLEVRIFRVMLASVVLAACVTAIIAPWRITSGLLLGGVLSLLNYSWLRSSVGAIIEANASGKTNGSRSARYVLRYVVITAAVFAAYKLNLISLPATVVGLCSFVVALFAEAFREFYLMIIHREGIN
jgi:hypothetical protein